MCNALGFIFRFQKLPKQICQCSALSTSFLRSVAQRLHSSRVRFCIATRPFSISTKNIRFKLASRVRHSCMSAQNRYQLSSSSRSDYGGYRSIFLGNLISLSTSDAGADGGVIHHGGHQVCFYAKYASSPRAACVNSYRNSSGLMRTHCHGACPCKRWRRRLDGALKVKTPGKS